MINVTPKPATGEKNCKTCGCPLYLLRLERRRWEARSVCARCSAPKQKPMLNPQNVRVVSMDYYRRQNALKKKSGDRFN